MARFVAFLRGMNLGGRRLSNPELCAAVEAVGFSAVQAFLASGNIVFESDHGAASVCKRLEAGLPEQLGYPVPAFVRSDRQVCTVAARDPFAGRKGHDRRGKLQVGFLRKKPSAGAAAAALELATEDDWLALIGSELYWLPRGGMSQSELDLNTLEKRLGGLTLRTKNTVERLTAKFLV